MIFPTPKLAQKQADDPFAAAPGPPPKPYTPLLILALTVLAVLVPFLFINSNGVDIITWRTDLDAAFTEAKAANKPLLLNFTADWCPPCKAMKRMVFSQAEVKESVETRFIPLRVDMTDRNEATKKLSERFQIDPIPTYLIMTADGEERARTIGGMSAADFLAWLKQAK